MLIRSSRARASGPSPPHVSTTKGRSSASWRLAMAAYFVRFLPSAALAVAVEVLDVDGRRRLVDAPPPRPTARAGQGTRSAAIWPKLAACLQPFHLAHRLPSRAAALRGTRRP